MQFQSDASGWGGAAVFESEWFQLEWSGPWCHTNIAVREFLPIVLALLVWGKAWNHTCLHFLCDNAAVVEVLNRRTAKDPLMLALL